MFPNGGVSQDTGDNVTVAVKPLVDALKKLPRRTTLPILLTPPLISLRNDKGEPTQVVVPVTDLENHSVETARTMDGRFPNYRQVIPPENKTAIEIVIDANHLLDMAQAALAFCKNGSPHMVPMKLCVGFENHGPLRVEVTDRNQRRLTMVVMPLQNMGKLVNRIDSTALQQVTGRLADIAGHLEAVATVLEAVGQRKARKVQVAAVAAEPVKQAA